MIDDVLDYSTNNHKLGKNVGDDLAEGKPTLPLLYAMWNSTGDDAAIIKDAIKNGGLENIDDVLVAIENTGAIAYTAALARKEAEAAMAILKDFEHSIYLDALYSLAKFAVDRHY